MTESDGHGGGTEHCNECGEELRPIRQNTDWETCMDCDGLGRFREAEA